MEQMIVILLIMILIMECVGVWSLYRLNGKIHLEPKAPDSRPIEERVNMQLGVLPIKRHSEQDLFYKEIARDKTGSVFS